MAIVFMPCNAESAIKWIENSNGRMNQCDSMYSDTSNNFQDGARINWIQDHCKIDNKIYTIRAYSYWPNHVKYRETYFEQVFPFKRKYLESFYIDGGRDMEITFKNDIYDGEIRKFGVNGKLKVLKIYKNGVIINQTKYDSLGHKIEIIKYENDLLKYILDSHNSFKTYKEYENINYYGEHDINIEIDHNNSYEKLSSDINSITLNHINLPDPNDIKNPIQMIAYISILENKVSNNSIHRNELDKLLEYLMDIDRPKGFYYGVIYDYLKNHSPYRECNDGLCGFDPFIWFKDRLLLKLSNQVTVPVLISHIEKDFNDERYLSYFVQIFRDTKYENVFIEKYLNYLLFNETCKEDNECNGLRSVRHRNLIDSLHLKHPNIQMNDYSKEYCTCTDI